MGIISRNSEGGLTHFVVVHSNAESDLPWSEGNKRNVLLLKAFSRKLKIYEITNEVLPVFDG